MEYKRFDILVSLHKKKTNELAQSTMCQFCQDTKTHLQVFIKCCVFDVSMNWEANVQPDACFSYTEDFCWTLHEQRKALYDRSQCCMSEGQEERNPKELWSRWSTRRKEHDRVNGNYALSWIHLLCKNLVDSRTKLGKRAHDLDVWS